MLYWDNPVRSDTPVFRFARVRWRATGGAGGEICACLQNLFQAFSAHGPVKSRDMLRFLIARGTMHQQQWLAVIEEVGRLEGTLPIPSSLKQEVEHVKFSYDVPLTGVHGTAPPEGCWTTGASLGKEGQLAPSAPASYAQVQQEQAPGTGQEDRK
ncbi:manganese catalase family protein (plasmid) [Deinococcus taeanensis]|uniref:manganese catalase family protein n=1 Tax=Deinococcus taeanensis TaxID=2737050 RepID=UPI001CDC83D1|nr:manganese catalase family protein [Deinococcus taeanensis]UBV45016.1 manganese catalase family protein [Deinococcus taeanensis]